MQPCQDNDGGNEDNQVVHIVFIDLVKMSDAFVAIATAFPAACPAPGSGTRNIGAARSPAPGLPAPKQASSAVPTSLFFSFFPYSAM